MFCRDFCCSLEAKTQNIFLYMANSCKSTWQTLVNQQVSLLPNYSVHFLII